MAALDEDFTYSQAAKESNLALIRDAEEAYQQTAIQVNRKPDVILRTANPATTDVEYRQGSIWINQSTNKVYVLTSKSSGPASATWSLLN
jgi:hypothetical protein